MVDEPENTGISTGIPWVYDHTMNEPFVASLPLIGPSVIAMDALVLATRGSQSASTTTLYGSHSSSVFDVRKWMRQGVLPLYAVWTSPEGGTKPGLHADMWIGEGRLVNNLFDYWYSNWHSDLIFIAMGELAIKACSTAKKSGALVIETFSPSDCARGRNNLHIDKLVDTDVLNQANGYLKHTINKTTISW